MNNAYDVAIIGGGIHGVGIAQAAAAAGYRVLVIEKSALAHGTSSKSSKLIHGGLRYLESLQFSLVRQSLAERKLLLALAPELVRLVPFYIPVYPATRRRPWQIRLGLSLYALLGGLAPPARFATLSRAKWQTLDGLTTRNLQTVFRYFDAQTDDAALTRAVMKSAEDLGAELTCPAEFLGAEKTQDGYRLQYQTSRRHECHARVLVNAAGPWANKILGTVIPQAGQQPVELVQGTHVVLAGALTQGVYYLEAPRDARAVFVMPWHGQTLVGTTETLHTSEPEAATPLPHEIDYLVQTFQHYFPANPAIVVGAFAGLRVLPVAPTKAFHRPRDTLFHVDRKTHPRLLTVYGGKLTGFRAAAHKTLARLAPLLPARQARADTAKLPLRPA
jgi:glycerol-3-phosphate dehydrogenase